MAAMVAVVGLADGVADFLALGGVADVDVAHRGEAAIDFGCLKIGHSDVHIQRQKRYVEGRLPLAQRFRAFYFRC